MTKYNILLIEDNQDDVFLIDLGLKESGIKTNLTVINNGKTATAFINNVINSNMKLPDLIILDINLPLINGLDVLKEFKSRKELSLIPTVVFTSSDSKSDMNFCYRHKAELFIKKPNNINDFKKIMLTIKEHCLEKEKVLQN